ncbi:MAG TPA: CDP-alcohol phosphatidyltransferase family protein [Kofleriaceae bacterium]|nr:CDP-alcohol phosphatidyltransferase family protein [Kofleriaceae bacterium]
MVSPPNLVTATRLPLAASVWIAPGSTWFVAAVLTLAAASDVIDGWLARLLARRRPDPGAARVGAWLDPMCDKIFMLSAATAIFVSLRPPLLIILLIITRELILVPLVVLYRLVPGVHARLGYDFSADATGKIATVTQFCALGAIIADPTFSRPLAIAAGATGTFAAATYLRRVQATLHR